MDAIEIRLRLIEAAAAHPVPHKDGFVAGALEAAGKWEEFVTGKISGKVTLGLPKKAA